MENLTVTDSLWFQRMQKYRINLRDAYNKILSSLSKAQFLIQQPACARKPWRYVKFWPTRIRETPISARSYAKVEYAVLAFQMDFHFVIAKNNSR